ncbi:MAG: hypothetical protein QOG59_2617 [Solirubrobacteraceae bacterium]|nr:hypothetical protein [Solirubrobacteraceae bacterium]
MWEASGHRGRPGGRRASHHAGPRGWTASHRGRPGAPRQSGRSRPEDVPRGCDPRRPRVSAGRRRDRIGRRRGARRRARRPDGPRPSTRPHAGGVREPAPKSHPRQSRPLTADDDRALQPLSRLFGASLVLFLMLTGLADGLAPKERRYAEAISPNNCGSPASSTRLGAAGIQLGGENPNIARGRRGLPLHDSSRSLGDSPVLFASSDFGHESGHIRRVAALDDPGRHDTLAQARLRTARRRGIGQAAVVDRVEHEAGGRPE